MTKLFVAIDIGCIECGEESHLLGVFTTVEQADNACRDAYIAQKAHWHGQHDFIVFNWDGTTDVPTIPDYIPQWEKEESNEH